MDTIPTACRLRSLPPRGRGAVNLTGTAANGGGTPAGQLTLLPLSPVHVPQKLAEEQQGKQVAHPGGPGNSAPLCSSSMEHSRLEPTVSPAVIMHSASLFTIRFFILQRLLRADDFQIQLSLALSGHPQHVGKLSRHGDALV